jgi:SulP family sulfate permease
VTDNDYDTQTETRGSTRRECVGQGLGNLVSGCFSGMGGCALIGQSLINVNSGGRGRVSGIAMSLALGTGILFAAPLLGQVPLASVAGLMFVVCIKTFGACV